MALRGALESSFAESVVQDSESCHAVRVQGQCTNHKGEMDFPVYIEIFGARIHPHPVFEMLAYFVGFRLYLSLRKRAGVSTQTPLQRLSLLAGALMGAAIGAHVLGTLEHLPESLGWAQSVHTASTEQPDHAHLNWLTNAIHALGLEQLLIGKTIVGGLIGGWIGVEIAKRFSGLRESTGDVMVVPLAVGMAIGRIGCFLTGIEDATYGVETTLPWAIDFGDGVMRHPTQLYDIIFLATLAFALTRLKRTQFAQARSGVLFRAFMASYLLWRFSVDFIKPTPTLFAGMTAIQMACAITGSIALISLWRLKPREEASEAESESSTDTQQIETPLSSNEASA